jgi:hypothetical protein
MSGTAPRSLAIVVFVLAVCASLVVAAQPASAFPPGDPVFPFNYTVNASTHIKKLNQTITVPPGKFTGGIDLKTSRLTGSITLPPASFTYTPAGLPLGVTATAQIVQVKPVTGKVNLANLRVTATSTFNIRIIHAYAALPALPLPLPIPPVNLVGNNCTTATPVSVTMTGTANLGGASTFSGIFTIPNFKSCGAATAGLNLLIPGPGNTFTAKATP